jgi:hypothetical protein
MKKTAAVTLTLLLTLTVPALAAPKAPRAPAAKPASFSLQVLAATAFHWLEAAFFPTAGECRSGIDPDGRCLDNAGSQPVSPVLSECRSGIDPYGRCLDNL